MSKKQLRIRDFVYLDTERLKSILSQVDEGVLTEHSKTRAHELGADVGASSSFFELLKAEGKADYLWRNEATETRTLHDHMYNLVEDLLVSEGRLLEIPSALSPEQVVARDPSSGLTSTSFVLIRGLVELEAYGAMRSFLSRFNELTRFVAYCSLSEDRASTSQEVFKKKLKTAAGQYALDKELQEGLELVCDMFYEDRLSVRLCPDPGVPECRFSGTLRHEFLRDELTAIVRKYTTAPSEPWSMLAQVASMPVQAEAKPLPTVTQSEVEQAFSGVFAAYRSVQRMTQSVAYPEVAVTPIALYRD